jgi:micrococcal nuclease
MEPMRKLAVLAPLLLCLAVLLGLPGTAGSERSAGRAAFPRRATIDHAVDGDTLRVRLASGDLLYVRLVGIDTPEDVKPGTPVECGSRQAATSMARLAPERAPVRLVPDSVADEYDHYGRLLAHAFVGGRQLELAQLRRGWAEVYRYDDQRFDGLAAFERVSAGARRADRGVWGECGGDFHSSR